VVLQEKKIKVLDEEVEKSKFKFDILWQQLPEIK
jgi:hypothetical protein